MGQKEGAEPNAGHAAAPTALRGLKITLFTHFQSWFLPPCQEGLRLHYAHVPTAHLLLGWWGPGLWGLFPWAVVGGGR